MKSLLRHKIILELTKVKKQKSAHYKMWKEKEKLLNGQTSVFDYTHYNAMVRRLWSYHILSNG